MKGSKVIVTAIGSAQAHIPFNFKSFYRQINAIQCESNSIQFNKVSALTNVNDF